MPALLAKVRAADAARQHQEGRRRLVAAPAERLARAAEAPAEAVARPAQVAPLLDGREEEAVRVADEAVVAGDLCGNQPLVWGVPTKLQKSLARSNRSRFG